MERDCTQCKQSFSITPEDQAVLDMFQQPAPVHCPQCRQQRRLAWRCERSLYYRACDLCSQQHMSSYRPDAPFPVYCVDCFYSDKWDQYQHGREFDFSRPFFEQYYELQQVSPRASLFIAIGTIESSPYINTATAIKNCHLIFAATTVEDSYYSNMIRDCVSCCDCTEVYNCELVYDSINCDGNYGTVHCEDSNSCRDAAFLYDCVGSSDCFMSSNLRNARFVWRNQQLTEEQYKAKRAEIDLGSYAQYQACVEEFATMKQKAIRKYYHGSTNEASDGDYMINCAYGSKLFDCYDVEKGRYVSRMYHGKDLYDVDYFGGVGTEMVYNSVSIGGGSNNVRNTNQSWPACTDLEYCDNALNGSKHCFGSVSLRKAQYCILNKQYSPEEYSALKERIIAHMKETGEYGQFFPPHMSHVPYSDSIAADYIPLNAESAAELGYRWEEPPAKPSQPATKQLPDHSSAVDASWSQEILQCNRCSKNYKLIPQEIEMYHKLQVPVPRNCFDCRLRLRLDRKNSRTLSDMQCQCQEVDHLDHEGQCTTRFWTTYSPAQSSKVYCESCYQKAIY